MNILGSSNGHILEIYESAKVECNKNYLVKGLTKTIVTEMGIQRHPCVSYISVDSREKLRSALRDRAQMRVPIGYS